MFSEHNGNDPDWEKITIHHRSVLGSDFVISAAIHSGPLKDMRGVGRYFSDKDSMNVQTRRINLLMNKFTTEFLWFPIPILD